MKLMYLLNASAEVGLMLFYLYCFAPICILFEYLNLYVEVVMDGAEEVVEYVGRGWFHVLLLVTFCFPLHSI